jgi:arylsulfatase A-like enzyme
MKKFSLLVMFFAFGAAASGQSVSRDASSKGKPNIIFILIDDMGYADLGCYGNAEAQTPYIDQLAAEGIRFTQYYASAPICSPSRVAVFTGQYPPRWRITSYIDSRAKNAARGMRDFLDLRALSVAKILSQSGYYTAHIGKWHMGGGRDVGEAPLITEYGFHESVSQFEGLGERYLATYETLDLKDSTRNLEKMSASLGRGQVHWEKRYRVTERFVDRTLRAMKHAQDVGKPFFINLWPDDVHTPLEPSPANRGRGTKHDLYLGVVKELDQQLGRVFDFVRQDPELASNTLIVVTSDNGPEPGAGSAGTLRGTKGSIYEGGIREPFIVWCPGKMAKDQVGTVNMRDVIVGMDLPPSFVALGGVRNDYPFDGTDMSNTFVGKPRRERTEPIMWQRPPDRKMLHGQPQPDLAIREGDFKMLMNTDGSGIELYDLSKDAEESKNIADSNPGTVKRLSEKVRSWYSTMPPIK